MNAEFAMEKILVIKPSSLGDILHALQVVETLRESRGRGNVEITWLVRDIFEPLLNICATVDRTIVFERGKGLRGIWETGMRLRRERFDLVLDMQGLARSAFWALCARAPRKIGRGDGREGSRLCFRELAGAPAAGFRNAHAVEILLQFLPELGLPAELRGKVEFPGAGFSDAIAERLAATGTDEAPILLFPDSRRAEKEWKGFAALTPLLLERFPKTPVVWVGQSRLRSDPAWEANPRFVNLMGKTRLSDVIALIARARRCITNDSGPMHIAAATGVPVLGLFGPTSPKLYGPFPLSRPSNRVLVAPDGDLARLSPQTVLEAV